MSNVLADKTILVTGGTGSIGREIVSQALRQQARKVIVFSRDEIRHFMMKRRLSDDSVAFVVGDARNARSLERIFAEFDIDVIYHAAAMKHVVVCDDFPLEAVETNILGVQNVIDMAQEYDVPRTITISTDKAIYPVNVMGATKFIAERITLNAHRKSGGDQVFSCVRFGNVSNSRGSAIPVFVDDLLNHRPLRVTNPDVTRFVMEIPEAAELIAKATEYAQGGEVFILKMRAFKLGDLLDVMVKRIAPKLGIQKEAVRIDSYGLVPGEKLHEDLLSLAEASRLYEMDGLYIVLDERANIQMYPSARRVELPVYSSKDVELLTKEELEEIVISYLDRRQIPIADV